MNIQLDYSIPASKRVNNHAQNAQAAHRVLNNEVDTGQLTPQQHSAQVKQYLKNKYNLTDSDLTKLSHGSVTTAELIAHGVDPTSASSDQIKSATMRIQMGRDLGLTPQDAAHVNDVQSMNSSQIASLMNKSSSAGGSQEATGLSSGASSAGGQSASSAIVAVGPPAPKMSAASYFKAITQALGMILATKAKVSQNDANTTIQQLRDVITQTGQKIAFATKQNEEMAASIRDAIDAMFTMRVIMYVVLAVMFIITVIVTVLTAGAGLAPMIAAMAAVAIALIAMIVTIVSMEMARKGKSLTGSSSGDQILLIVLAVAEVIAAIVGVGAVMKIMSTMIKALIAKTTAQIVTEVSKAIAKSVSTKVATEVGKQVAETVAEQVIVQTAKAGSKAVGEAVKTVATQAVESGVEKVVEKVADKALLNIAKSIVKIIGGKTIAPELIEQTVKTTSQEVIQKLIAKAMLNAVAKVLDIGAQVTSTMMQIVTVMNPVNKQATDEAKSDYKGSAEHSRVETKRVDDKAVVALDLANGKINQDQANIRNSQIDTTADTQNSSNISSMVVSYQASAQADAETTNWIMMGVTIGASIGAAIGQALTAEIADMMRQMTGTIASSATVAMISKITQFISTFIQLMMSSVQAGMQIQSEQAQIEYLQNSLESRQMIILLGATSDLWTALSDDMQEMLQSAQKSFSTLIAALSSAFDSSAQAMNQMIQAI